MKFTKTEIEIIHEMVKRDGKASVDSSYGNRRWNAFKKLINRGLATVVFFDRSYSSLVGRQTAIMTIELGA